MIYFLRLPTGSIKIGCTRHFSMRMRQLKRHYGHEFEVVARMPGYLEEEGILHERFADSRFKNTEQFDPSPELDEFIGQLLHGDPSEVSAKLLPPPKEPPFRSRDEIWSGGLTPDEKEVAPTQTLDEAVRDGFLVEAALEPGGLEKPFFAKCKRIRRPLLKIVIWPFEGEIHHWGGSLHGHRYIKEALLTIWERNGGRKQGGRRPWLKEDRGKVFLENVPLEYLRPSVNKLLQEDAFSREEDRLMREKIARYLERRRKSRRDELTQTSLHGER